MAEPIPDAVVIAAIELVLKPLGSASLKHYMPGPKADCIAAMRGVLMAERERAASEADNLHAGEFVDPVYAEGFFTALNILADAIRNGAA